MKTVEPKEPKELKQISLSSKLFTADQMGELIQTGNILVGDGRVDFSKEDYEQLENSIGDGGNAKSIFNNLSPILEKSLTETILGKNSLAIGGYALGDNSIAIGMLNRTGKYPDKAFATGDSSIALGNLAMSTGRGSVALGSGFASGFYSLALGGGKASGECSVAFGSVASGDVSFAQGVSNEASGTGSVAFGHTTKAIGEYSFAAGRGATSSGACSFSFGHNAKAIGEYSVAMGMGTKATGVRSFAMGYSSEANGPNSFAQGYDSVAEGTSSQAFGYGAYAKGDMSHSDGYYASTCLETKEISHGSLEVNNGDIVQWTDEGWKFAADKSHAEEEPYKSDINGVMTPAYEACKMANNDYSFLTGGRPVNGKYYQIKPDGGRDKGTIYWAFFEPNNSKCNLAWCWNGDISKVNSISGRMYNSHGDGTFNINPKDGTKGFYIGERSLHDILSGISPEYKPLDGKKWTIGDTRIEEIVVAIAEALGAEIK